MVRLVILVQLEALSCLLCNSRLELFLLLLDDVLPVDATLLLFGFDFNKFMLVCEFFDLG